MKKKIFLTVGVQVPFDRLVQCVSSLENHFDIRGQVGNTSLNLPQNYRKFISEKDYVENILWADAVVAHAGMGSVLTSLEYSKKIFLLPRLASLGEHRNDHQLDTVRHLRNLEDSSLFTIAETSEELCFLLQKYSEAYSHTSKISFDFKSRCILGDFLKNEI